MKVPQFLPWVGQDEYKRIESCFDINWITEGPLSKEFISRLLEMTGAKHGVLAPNGTLALYLALRAAGIEPGDEVLVPDFTFIGSATSIEMVGATPVFVDVNTDNFQIDCSKAEKLITSKTKGIMPVHIYGTSANMDEVMAFSQKHGLTVVEDAAQALGVSYKSKHCGTFGKTGAFSFFADKTITTGEGGLILTDDDNVYDRLLYLRNQGRLNRGSFVHPEVGYNFRMTDIQCAIGLQQLDKFEEIKERKASILKHYESRLANVGDLIPFKPEENANYIPFRVCVRSQRAENLMDYMKENEIETRTFFYPLHKQPCFQHLNDEPPSIQKLDDDCFPNAVAGYNTGVSLPSFPTISTEQLDYVCDVIVRYFDKVS